MGFEAIQTQHASMLHTSVTGGGTWRKGKKNAKVSEFLIISPEEKTHRKGFTSHKCLLLRGPEARIPRC